MFRNVIPHLGVNVAGTIGKGHGQVEVAALLGLGLLGGHHERRGDYLVFKTGCIGYVKIFHADVYLTSVLMKGNE